MRTRPSSQAHRSAAYGGSLYSATTTMTMGVHQRDGIRHEGADAQQPPTPTPTAEQSMTTPASASLCSSGPSSPVCRRLVEEAREKVRRESAHDEVTAQVVEPAEL